MSSHKLKLFLRSKRFLRCASCKRVFAAPEGRKKICDPLTTFLLLSSCLDQRLREVKHTNKCRHKRYEAKNIQRNVYTKILRKNCPDHTTESAPKSHEGRDDSEQETKSSGSSAQVVGNKNIKCPKDSSTNGIE